MKLKYPVWVQTMLASPVFRRKQWIEELINGFREYRKGSDDKTKKYLSDVLLSGKEYELVGFTPLFEYIKVDGDEDELNCIWRHPNMNPALLYKHKKLPIFIITGPGLRFNDSVLNEVGIRSEGVRGITG